MGTMRVLVGTSGYSYKEWKGPFYPKDLPAARFLGFYAETFKTVEINNTFYRMPTAKLVEGWASEVPEGFTFALKAPQRITHIGEAEGRGRHGGHVRANGRRCSGRGSGPCSFSFRRS